MDSVKTNSKQSNIKNPLNKLNQKELMESLNSQIITDKDSNKQDQSTFKYKKVDYDKQRHISWIIKDMIPNNEVVIMVVSLV